MWVIDRRYRLAFIIGPGDRHLVGEMAGRLITVQCIEDSHVEGAGSLGVVS